ncbi:NAD(P)/FAD-dependent oxidoreductase [Roseibium sp. RKSG952]|uniref:NAD(P)/FAD-dependent oxidoreductase n=1 Tax=Roseibium sp. RKSG952 TaxID=2529384 RepID=UPI0018AD297B|nr:tryptophan 7-halogenase [Roseibium sp. RKSG952]
MTKNTSCDLLIIGSGPSGLLAALGALRADPDLDVVILDPEEGRRHRIGEALLTGTVMTLHDAGISDEIAAAGFHHKIGAAYLWGKTRNPWYVNYLEGEGDYPKSFIHDGRRHSIHVPRHEFDPLLADCARRQGIRILPERATDLKYRDDSILCVVTSSGTRFSAKRYLDCTGQGSFIGRRLARREPVGQARIARYFYASNVDWAKAEAAGYDRHRTNILSGANGWIWVIDLGEAGNGLTSMGFVSTPDIIKHLDFRNAERTFPQLSSFGDVLREPKTFDGKSLKAFYGHPDYSFVCSRLNGANWALSGDAALFIDPILSQGVTLACHYGFLRGRAAAAEINGSEDRQTGVTDHYRREASVMRDVVGKWYDNNKSIDGWHMMSVMHAKKITGDTLSGDNAFRWITNLENLRGEYDPYPECERALIDRNLGLS